MRLPVNPLALRILLHRAVRDAACLADATTADGRVWLKLLQALEVRRISVISRDDETRVKFAVAAMSPPGYHGDLMARLGVTLQLRVGAAARPLGQLMVGPAHAGSEQPGQRLQWAHTRRGHSCSLWRAVRLQSELQRRNLCLLRQPGGGEEGGRDSDGRRVSMPWRSSTVRGARRWPE